MRSNSQLHNQISCCDSSTLARSIAEPRLQSHHENDALLLTHYLFR
ncbi:unnamed protein product [Tenebrio molitor]|nr:unnamed protein product [Tenebrio molitor]